MEIFHIGVGGGWGNMGGGGTAMRKPNTLSLSRNSHNHGALALGFHLFWVVAATDFQFSAQSAIRNVERFLRNSTRHPFCFQRVKI